MSSHRQGQNTFFFIIQGKTLKALSYFFRPGLIKAQGHPNFKIHGLFHLTAN